LGAKRELRPKVVIELIVQTPLMHASGRKDMHGNIIASRCICLHGVEKELFLLFIRKYSNFGSQAYLHT